MKQIIYYLTILSIFTLLHTSPAAAITLDEAKSRGLAGEMQNGYLGLVVSTATPDVQTLVSEVNAQRKGKYFEIAQKNGTTVGAVEAIAGKKAVAETAPGNYIQGPSGKWEKK